MPVFEREDRYIVFKISDLTPVQLVQVRCLINPSPRHPTSMFDPFGHDEMLPTVECVVVEADWDCYEKVWALVENEWAVRQEPASPKVASDTAPGVRYRSECRCRCHQPGYAVMHVQPCCQPDPAALAASPTASDTDTAIPGGEVKRLRAENARLSALISDYDEAERQHCINWGPCTRMKIDPDRDARLSAASPKPDTDTPVDPSVEGVREMAVLLRSAGLQAMAARVEAVDRHPGHVDALMAAGGTWMKLMNDAADMLEALAAKPITGMDAGEVKVRQCPHGEPLNACADCKREHQEATA